MQMEDYPMREDLLNEIESELVQTRTRNEQEERRRREQIETEDAAVAVDAALRDETAGLRQLLPERGADHRRLAAAGRAA